MSTLRIRASHLPEASVLPRLASIVSFVGAVIEVFAEADELARAAHKRYPFVGG
jgi:hypothetical protein